MRIAFDVLGTIQGPKGQVILEAFRKLQEMGHTCTVWSSSYSLAVEAVKENNLQCDYMEKFKTWETTDPDSGLTPFDVAIEDDHRQKLFLASKRFIMVNEITTTGALIDAILGN